MALHFTTDPHPEFVLMTYGGNYEPSLAGEFVDQVMEACRIHQASKLLVDFRGVQGDMSVFERFDLGSVAAAKYFSQKSTGKIPNCRFAFVGNIPLVDAHRFGETVALNRGLNVKVFTDIKEGLLWLAVEPKENERLKEGLTQDES